MDQRNGNRWEGMIEERLKYIEMAMHEATTNMKEIHKSIRDIVHEMDQSVKDLAYKMNQSLETIRTQRQADHQEAQTSSMEWKMRLAYFLGGVGALLGLLWLVGPSLLARWLRGGGAP
jgi:NAD-specific glutamate dehydrogenase